MSAFHSLRPHPAIVKPVIALALAVWILVGSVIYLVAEERSTQRRVDRLESVIDSCLGPKQAIPRCKSLYNGLVKGLSPEQLQDLRVRLESAKAVQ